MGSIPVVCVVFVCGLLVPVLGDKHSLFYIYTALSKDVTLPGIYEFTALGLLNDRAIDYYNSKEQVKVPKQDWMKEKMQPDYWDKGTQSRKSKEQWFKVNVDILMQRMRHNETDLHILQWRHGCEIEEADGKLKFLRGIDEYSYDGEGFLSFDDENMRWIAPVPEALPTKRKWDDVAILNQYTKGYLEKECVDWLIKFMQYGIEALRNMHSKPEVHAFAKKSTTNSGRLTLTCLATGFYPKDVRLDVRKFRTSVPEHLLTSSGVRPNGDGTYQLRKSVEIQEDNTAEYDCYVNHVTLEKPIIIKWDKMCFDCQSSGLVEAVIGVVVLLVIFIGIFVLIKMRKKCKAGDSTLVQTPERELAQPIATMKIESKAGDSDSGSDSGMGTGSTDSNNENREGGSSDSGRASNGQIIGTPEQRK
ncbi:hypothetical protein SRHO_G00100880 [Serrasalmus rhombeus]